MAPMACTSTSSTNLTRFSKLVLLLLYRYLVLGYYVSYATPRTITHHPTYDSKMLSHRMLCVLGPRDFDLQQYLS